MAKLSTSSTGSAADDLEPVVGRPVAGLQPHPAASRLPSIGKEEFRALREDIARRGIQEPLVVTAAGVVLDGHLRLRAASELGLDTVPTRIASPSDEVEYVMLATLQRRHLTTSQRAAIAVELDEYRRAAAAARRRRLSNLKAPAARADVAELPPQGRTRDRAAAWSGVSARTIQNAATVQAYDPQLFAEVMAGRLPADRAARRVMQTKRDAELPPPAPMPQGPFELIYADPPWQLPGNPDSSRAVENHYPTLGLERIASMQIPASADSVLYLWAVPSMLPEALEVMQAWGFSFRGEHVWAKDKIGLGAWNRNQHEPLLVGVRGAFKPPTPERRFSSLIHAPRGRHSAKPEQIYDLLEGAYPRASKLELFRRGSARSGWTIWGNEAQP